LQKNDISNYEELLQFVISQCSSIEKYLSAATTLNVSFLSHQLVVYCESSDFAFWPVCPGHVVT